MNRLRTWRRFPWWHELVLLSLLIGLLCLAEHAMPGFLAWKSQRFLSRQLWEPALLSVGMTLIILTGGIDLSVGSAMGMSAVTFGWIYWRSQSVPLSVVGCILAGTLGGLLNGTLIARFRIHPLIVTLSTYAAFRGIAEGASQGREFAVSADFGQLVRQLWFGLPLPAWLVLLVFAAAGYLLARVPLGTFLYAIGHNELATRFSGIPVDRIKLGLYTFSGFLAGLATVLHISRFGSARANAGAGFELEVITAVVVGGTSIFGGRGNLWGTLLGVVLIHETGLFVSRQWRIDELKPIVVGLLLIVSVLAYRVFTGGDDEQR